MANIKGHGTFDDLGGKLNSHLKGNWLVHWPAVNQLLVQWTGNAVSFTGGSWQPFELKGPLLPPKSTVDGAEPWLDSQLVGRTALQWEKAELYQLPVGNTKIDVLVDKSIAQFTANSQSQIVDQLMKARPTLDLRQTPMLSVAEGPLLQGLQIKSEDARELIKYVAPIIADSTSATGSVSVSSEGIHVPLLDPLKASARGTMELGELTIGPGPLLNKVLPLLDQIQSLLRHGSDSLQGDKWLRLKPQTVPFSVQDGRVHHEGLRFNYKNLVVTTKGSVGFDQSMNLSIQVPIVDDWLENQPLLAGLKGQSIVIPVSGTLTKPKLDANAVSQLTQQFLRDSAKGAINNAVGQQVDKFQGQVNEKVTGELERLRGKVNQKIGEGVGENLENQLRDGLNDLFKRKDR
jgi:hypothetical protein